MLEPLSKRNNTLIDMIHKHFLINHHYYLTPLDVTDVEFKLVEASHLKKNFKDRFLEYLEREHDLQKFTFHKRKVIKEQMILIAFENGEMIVDYSNWEFYWFNLLKTL